MGEGGDSVRKWEQLFIFIPIEDIFLLIFSISKVIVFISKKGKPHPSE